MNKYWGNIGFSETVETSPGVFEESVNERFYTGEITRNSYSANSGSGVNDDIQTSTQISIVNDGYLCENAQKILYVYFMGEAWKVKNVAFNFPRAILTLGGVYNGPKAETS